MGKTERTKHGATQHLAMNLTAFPTGSKADGHLCAVPVDFSFPGSTPGLCSLCLTPSLCPQSEDHVPEVPSQLVEACCEKLEQEPSKELFKESTK